MSKYQFLYLSEEDILSLDIKWGEIFNVVEKALIEKGYGTVENPPKPGVHSKENSFIHAMPAYLEQMKAIGIKWAAGYPSNREKGLPTVTGLEIINSVETGLPLAVMNATWLTNMRTGAVSALSANHLAKKDSKVIGLIGAGVQGRIQMKALDQLIDDLELIKVYDVYESSSLSFKEEIENELDINVEIADSQEEAARNSDIVMTAVPKPKKPIIKFEWLKEGALCMPLESSRAWENETLFGADKFINDDLEQAKLYQTQGAFNEGIPDLYAETGEVIAGIKDGRENDKERIMVMNIGLASVDVAFGQYIYNKAIEKGIGKTLSL